MRRGFIQALTELARQDPRLVLLTADLGYTVIEPFAEAHPQRFFNVGVAEQHMLGLATGLAEAGFVPFCYSIVSFAALRPYEFFRNGPVLHRLPVRLVGVGGGLEYGLAGPTHWGLEDIAVMRALPGARVYAPADHRQAAALLRASWDLPGPIYYRLGKDDHTEVPGLEGRFAADEVDELRPLGPGAELVILTTGGVAPEAAAACQALAQDGLAPRLVSCCQLAPPPVAALRRALAGCRAAITYEAHGPDGGLGSLVAEVIAEAGLPVRLTRLAARPADARVGGAAYMQRACGLGPERLAETARDVARALSAGDAGGS